MSSDEQKIEGSPVTAETSAETAPVEAVSAEAGEAVATEQETAQESAPNGIKVYSSGKAKKPKPKRKRLSRTAAAQKRVFGGDDVSRESEYYYNESGDYVATEGDVVIKFDHVTKTYRLFKDDGQRLSSVFWSKKKREQIMSIDANKDLSFEIRRGEAVAFFGTNGAGKSTALKMVTGVKYPTSGTVEVNGHVSALLDLTAGFNRNLTGRENIHLRGQALGFTKEELKELEPKTVQFAELGVFIDQPVRMYSSGMRSRLGFGFAVSFNPEILVVDETLAVGDKRFRRKCYKRVREIVKNKSVTVLFVTHSLHSAKEFCKRGIVIDHGQKMFDGPIEDAIEFYNTMIR